MEQSERNHLTLLPFCAAALLASAALCIAAGYGWPRLAWMFVLWTAVCFFGWLALFVLVCCVISLFLPGDTEPPVYRRGLHRTITYVMGLLSALLRVRIHSSGAAQLPAEGRWLLVCNHRSAFDPIVTGWVLRRHRLAFVMKPSLAAMPVVGAFLRTALFLPIDREDDRAALKTILTAAKRMKEGLLSYGIYPEGTRAKGPELLPFRNGAFKIAQRAKTPVVVARIRGTDGIFRNFPWKHTDVCLDIAAVFDAETVAALSTSELSARARKAILSVGVLEKK